MTAAYDTRLPPANASAQASSIGRLGTCGTAGTEPRLVTSRSPNEPDGRSHAGIAAGAGAVPSGAKASGESAGTWAERASAATGRTAPGPIRADRLSAVRKTRVGFAIDGLSHFYHRYRPGVNAGSRRPRGV